MVRPALRQLLSLDAERGRLTSRFQLHGHSELKKGPSSWRLQRSIGLRPRRAAISPIPATMPFQDWLCRLSQELILSDVWKMALLSHSVPFVPSATAS